MSVTLAALFDWPSLPDWTGAALTALAAVGAVVIALLYPAMILRKYIRIMINLMDDHDPEPENGHHHHSGLSGESVSFRAADGHGLSGVIVRGEGDRGRGLIVFAHELGSDRKSCVRYCGAVLAAGYDVFAFDFRGHGASPPEVGYRPRWLPSNREQADMLGAIAFAKDWLGEHDRPPDLGLFGVSRGGSAALIAAVGIENVRAIVTDGAFSSDMTLEHWMRRFATIFARIRVVAQNHPPMFWRFLRWLLFRECARRFGCRYPSVRKAIRKLSAKPILLIHGEKDSYIPAYQSEFLHSLAAGPKELWIVPGARHNQSILIQPDEYAGRLVRFFDRYLVAGGVTQTGRRTYFEAATSVELSETAASAVRVFGTSAAPTPSYVSQLVSRNQDDPQLSTTRAG